MKRTRSTVFSEDDKEILLDIKETLKELSIPLLKYDINMFISGDTIPLIYDAVCYLRGKRLSSKYRNVHQEIRNNNISISVWLASWDSTEVFTKYVSKIFGTGVIPTITHRNIDAKNKILYSAVFYNSVNRFNYRFFTKIEEGNPHKSENFDSLGNIKKILAELDFEHCKPFYDVGNDKLYISPLQLELIKDKKTHFFPEYSCCADSMRDIWLNRGYTIIEDIIDA